ncbi:MAG: hypothetical protein QW331_02990 [Candidatus Woesearchaeota archaeon]
MDQKTTIIVIVIAVLVVFAGVQMYQINSLKNTLSGGVTTQTIAPQSGAAGGGASVPANIQNLPSMVGGC